MPMQKRIIQGVEVRRGSDNVFADLGLPDANELLVKAKLACKISEIITEKGWTQQEAASRSGLSQSKLSTMLRGHFDNISEAKMMDCLVRLGRPVQIVVGKPTRRKIEPVQVVFA